MLRKRIIVCLDIRDGRVLHGPSNDDLHDIGDPVALALHYAQEGADEIFFFDISTSAEGRRTLLDVVTRTAERLFIPLTVGGGINEVADIALVLRAGADKVSINTAGLKRPDLIGEASVRFGRHCVVASIDARVEKRQIELVARTEGAPALTHSPSTNAPPPPTVSGTWFRVFAQGGRTATELDAIAWARHCAELGAGEVLVTSIDQDGRRRGFDLELTARVVEAVNVPVIASGGAGTPEHMRDVFLLSGADAALAADIFLDGSVTIREVKRVLSAAGIPVRDTLPPNTPHQLQS